MQKLGLTYKFTFWLLIFNLFFKSLLPILPGTKVYVQLCGNAPFPESFLHQIIL